MQALLLLCNPGALWLHCMGKSAHMGLVENHTSLWHAVK